MQTDDAKDSSVSVQLSDHYIKVGDRRVPLLSGQIDYWLHPAMHWRKILSAIRDCSLPIVACYVPGLAGQACISQYPGPSRCLSGSPSFTVQCCRLVHFIISRSGFRAGSGNTLQGRDRHKEC